MVWALVICFMYALAHSWEISLWRSLGDLVDPLRDWVPYRVCLDRDCGIQGDSRADVRAGGSVLHRLLPLRSNTDYL